LLKKKRKFSLKGQKLLEIKREQLQNQLKSTLNFYFKQRARIRDQVLRDYQLLERSYEIIGKNKVANIAMLNRAYYGPTVDVTFVNQLGVDVPKVTLKMNDITLPSYSFSDTSMHMDILIQDLKVLLQDLVKLSELDSILYHFANAYQTIQRRINALEDIILPRLDKNIQMIEEILEDNEREEFIRLKKIKEFLEAKNSEEDQHKSIEQTNNEGELHA
jgi:V/A-type H+/Na+-transporting ATPase subunit D